MRRIATIAGILCYFAFSATAQESVKLATSNSDGKSLTPEALISLRRLSDLEFSPDGSRLAFVVSEPPKADLRAGHIWLYDIPNNSFRQLTYSEKSESSPKWSPDGKYLGFLSNRDVNQQIYLLSMRGGESFPLTKGKRNISHFAWAHDSSTIAFLAPEAKSDTEEKKEKDKDDARVSDKDEKHPRLWLINIADKSERAITPANFAVSDEAWFPDNKTLAVIATDHPESDRNTERIFSVSTAPVSTAVSDSNSVPASTAMKQLLAPRGPFDKLNIAPSSHILSFVGSREDGPAPHDLWLLPPGMPAAKNLTSTDLDRAVFGYRWSKDSGLVLLAADGFNRKLVRYSPSGERDDIPTPGAMTSSFALSDNGTIAFVGENFTEPQELWIASPNQQPKKLSAFNKAIEPFAIAKPEVYKYKSFDGLEIETALLKPANYDGKSKLPLITLIHGGPTGAWESSIEPWGQLLVARGYAVFYPNIRGSVGYGEKFIESNRADWGGADFQDVLKGIEDLVDKGIADPTRLGIGGWSYGGYMSEWAITQKTKYPFKAAVSGAGMANLVSEYGAEQHPSYDEWFWGVPYEKPAGFLNHSPFVFLKDARTPTLILQGDADTVDPLGQSQELYRGLKRYGVDTELVVYPREPHGFHEEKHLVDRLNRIVAWYDAHMK
jgi:dipeptidyl aminopeptidase/acylaminoacyl peptidase